MYRTIIKLQEKYFILKYDSSLSITLRAIFLTRAVKEETALVRKMCEEMFLDVSLSFPWCLNIYIYELQCQKPVFKERRLTASKRKLG